MTIKAEQIYKEEWTKVDYLDFRDNLRGQGKRCGGMVKGAMFDRAVCRLIKRKIKWGNYPYFTDEERKLFLSSSALGMFYFNKVMLETGNKDKALLALCEHQGI